MSELRTMQAGDIEPGLWRVEHPVTGKWLAVINKQVIDDTVKLVLENGAEMIYHVDVPISAVAIEAVPTIQRREATAIERVAHAIRQPWHFTARQDGEFLEGWQARAVLRVLEIDGG